MYTVWHVDKYKITFKLVINHWTDAHSAHSLRPSSNNHSEHNQCRTPYAVIHGLVLLMMGIMMPETC